MPLNFPHPKNRSKLNRNVPVLATLVSNSPTTVETSIELILCHHVTISGSPIFPGLAKSYWKMATDGLSG